MCGIFGVWQTDRDPERLRHTAEAGVAALHHRGPDATGVWLEPDEGLALAQARLAIVDLSPAGFQPMLSRSGVSAIVYNGELYNTAEVSARLTSCGVRLRGHSDTEALVEALDLWGLNKTLDIVNGIFAFGWWNALSRELVLCRDAVGVKPLVWYEDGQQVAFASEIRALETVGSLRLELDESAIAAYMCRSAIPAPLTIYSRVHKLRPGETAVFRSRSAAGQCATWFDGRRLVESGMARRQAPLAERMDCLNSTLRDVVRSQLVADVPVGTFLSGGIDSSLVTAITAAVSDTPLKAFSIGSIAASFDEVPFAEAVARKLGLQCVTRYADEASVVNVIRDLPRIYDEPFADSSQIPTTLVSRLARADVTVALSGDGGDELFGGYTRHMTAPFLWRSINLLGRSTRTDLGARLAAVSDRKLVAVGQAFAPLLGRWLRPSSAGYFAHKFSRAIGASDFEGFMSELSGRESFARSSYAAENDRAKMAGLSLDHFEMAMQWDFDDYLPNDILAKVDRASMSASLEVRVPLLDVRIIESSWAFSSAEKIRFGKGKKVLRSILGRYIDASLFDRPKTGFGVPIGQLLRGTLKSWAESIVHDTVPQLPYVDGSRVERCWREHQTGVRGWEHELWHVLMLAEWLESRGLA